MPHTSTGVPFAAGSPTSYEAAIRVAPYVGEQGLKVWRWLRSRKEYGGTQKEAAAVLSMGRPSLAARFKALKDAGWILKHEEDRRAGCAVYFACVEPPRQQGGLLW